MCRDVSGLALEPGLAVVERRARLARDVLIEAPAEGDVQHLNAAADREQGDALRDRPARQLDLERIARRGHLAAGRMRPLAEACRVDVAAPGEQHTVDVLEDPGARRVRQLRRQRHGYATGLLDGVEI